MDAQLKRGILNICVLKLLENESMYGYELVKTIQQYFRDTEESTLYAILRRLNKEGLTDMYYSDVSNGPIRKYYSITELGRKHLKEYIDSRTLIEHNTRKAGRKPKSKEQLESELKNLDILLKEGKNERSICKTMKISRATYYRLKRNLKAAKK